MQTLAQQNQEYQSRAASLDRDNQELESLLAQSRQQIQLLNDELDATRSQLQTTTDQLLAMRTDNDQLRTQSSQLVATVQQRAGAEIRANNTLLKNLAVKQIPGIEVRQDGDVVRVEAPADRIFMPGSNYLQNGGEQLLESIGADLRRNFPDNIIGIEGHTDDGADALAAVSHEPPSVGRPGAGRYNALVQRGTMPANQLFVIGHGANHPVVSNASDAGKARNRRIEFVVYPERMARAVGSRRAARARGRSRLAIGRLNLAVLRLSATAASAPASCRSRLLHQSPDLQPSRMIAIIDYQMGNLRSVQKAFERVGHAAAITSDPRDARAGRQDRAAGRRRVSPTRSPSCAAASWSSRSATRSPRASRSWASAWACNCCSTSATKTASTRGSACCAGEVRRFDVPPEYKVPHMGWNQRAASAAGRRSSRASRTSRTSTSSTRTTWCRRTTAVVAGEASYPEPFCAMAWRDNLFATQFHPEKSQAAGLRVLKNFAEL